jgi:RNA polymerase sigma-70 factor (ECF subfamily)
MRIQDVQESSDALLTRLVAQDAAALDDLAAAYGRVLSRTAWCMLADHHAAEAAVQDTLLAAWTGAQAIRPGTALRTWLFAVLMNQCRKQQRSWTRWLRQRAGWIHQVPVPPDPRLAALQAALAQLSTPVRAVVVLRYLDGHSVQETAHILDCAVGTVKSRCHYALNQLRGLITTHGGSSDG